MYYESISSQNRAAELALNREGLTLSDAGFDSLRRTDIRSQISEFNKMATHALFNSFDIYRKIRPNDKHQFPWEAYYLHNIGLDAWTSDTLKEAPTQFDMARVWLASTVFPVNILDRMTDVAMTNERYELKLFKEKLLSSADEFLYSIPPQIAVEMGTMGLYALAGMFPELIPYISSAGIIESFTTAVVQANASDAANNFRRLALIGAPMLDSFFTSRGKELSSIHMEKLPSNIINENISGALTEIDSLRANIKLASRAIGGVATVSGVGTVTKEWPSLINIVTGGGISYAVRRLFIRENERTRKIFGEGIGKFNSRLNTWKRERNLDPKQARVTLHQVYEELDTLTDELNPRNRAFFAFSEVFPWAFTLLSSAVTDNASSLLLGQLLGNSVIDAGKNHVARDIAKKAADENVKLLETAMAALEQYVPEVAHNLIEETYTPPEEIVLGDITYRSGEPFALPTMKFKRGVNIIIGKSGSGKTTILDILKKPHNVAIRTLANVSTENGTVLRTYSESGWDRLVTSSSIETATPDFLGMVLIGKIRQGKAEGFVSYMRSSLESMAAGRIAEINASNIDRYDVINGMLETIDYSDERGQLADALTNIFTNTSQESGKIYAELFLKIATDYFQQFIPHASRQFLFQKLGPNAGGSTGERSRIGLALAFADTNASIILLDEPTSGLDETADAKFIQRKIIEFAQDQPDKIIILTPHDMDLVTQFMDTRNKGLVQTYADLTRKTITEFSNGVPGLIGYLHEGIELQRTRKDIHETLNEIGRLTTLIAQSDDDSDLDDHMLNLISQLQSGLTKAGSHVELSFAQSFRAQMQKLITALQTSREDWRLFLLGDMAEASDIKLFQKMKFVLLLQNCAYQINRNPQIRIGNEVIVAGPIPKSAHQNVPIIPLRASREDYFMPHDYSLLPMRYSNLIDTLTDDGPMKRKQLTEDLLLDTALFLDLARIRHATRTLSALGSRSFHGSSRYSVFNGSNYMDQLTRTLVELTIEETVEPQQIGRLITLLQRIPAYDPAYISYRVAEPLKALADVLERRHWSAEELHYFASLFGTQNWDGTEQSELEQYLRRCSIVYEPENLYIEPLIRCYDIVQEKIRAIPATANQ